MAEGLTAHTFVEPDEFKGYVARGLRAEENVEERIIRALNGSVALMESHCARRLRARNYRTAFTLSGFTLVSSDDGDVTVYRAAGGLSALVESGDDVRGVRAPSGQQVLTATDSYLTCTRPFDGESFTGSTSLTFGSRPLYLDGKGKESINLTEWPVKDVFALYSLGADGQTWEAIDSSVWRTDNETDRIWLGGSGYFETGTANIRAEFRAGYEEPTNSALGDEEWRSLKRAQLRVAEILFSDDLALAGRQSAYSVGNVSGGAQDFALPADVAKWLAPFRRLV